MEFKDTLNLPQTDFPMKANLPQKEPEILSLWEKINLYIKLREERKEEEKYILHDGPPYANGHIHIGHSLNKILKDILVKYQSMLGKDAPFVPGWDCHGLPIEQQVEKELKEKKIKKEELSKSEFRKLCREYALRFVNIQKEEFKRLGIIANWEKPYLTMRPSYQAQEILELGRIFKKGVAYRGKKPVYWCIYDKTAEAEAEIEYQDKKDPSVYVKFKSVDEDLYFVIWTTTPWTLPANLGIMVHPDYDYIYYKTEKGILVVAKELLGDFKDKTGLNGEIIEEIKGRELEFKEYFHPFVDRVSKVYLSEFVELSTGTGLVHMAPGHGQEDYIIGQKYNIEPFAPVDDEGRFTDEVPHWLRGIRVFDANPIIVDKLREIDALLHFEMVSHSYPHCWRCKNPVIFRATPQWFISMEKILENGNTLRGEALKEIEKVEWIPSYGKNRIKSMVENRPDWCISRQRSWGVPIAIFYCQECKTIVDDEEVFNHIADIIRNNPYGADIWFEKDPAELLPKGYRCKNCHNDKFIKEEDILDVWFDSGVSHASVLKFGEWSELKWPADMYLEGSDQHRGWFQSSLLESVASYETAPYKSVLTHGFTLDEKGRKMSKSAGNVVPPEKVVNEYGADILRLWVVTEDYTEDIKIGFGLIKKIAEDYRKIRNTFRFFLGNLYDFDPSKLVEYRDLLEIDRWMLSRLQIVLEQSYKAYREYRFHRIYHTIKNFMIVDLSAIYLDILKDRLYVYAPDSIERRSAQTVLWYLLRSLSKLLAPILSFTMEEVWQYVRKIDNSLKESIHLETMEPINEGFVDKNLEDIYSKLLDVRDDVLKALEEARKKELIRHPYEAKIILKLPKDYREIVENRREWIKFFFTVSQVELSEDIQTDVVIDSQSLKEGKVGVKKADGEKCPRCWIYDISVGKNGQKVCDRCLNELVRMNIKLEEVV